MSESVSTTVAMTERRMSRKRYEFVLEARQPIAHHAETIGNEAIAMRRKVRTSDGWAHVPVVTADTMRHGMREAAAYALLDAAGMLESPSLSESALRLLFAGGMVTGKGDAGSVKLDAYRELCELVPPMALFGGCAQNRVIPGRLIVEDATLICAETERYVPDWAVAFARDNLGELDACRAHVEEVQRVRMDPSLSPTKRSLLTDGAQVSVNARMLASEAGSESGDAVAKADAKSTMLPRRFERIAQGSLFFWACEAVCMSELDVDTLHVAAAAFLANAKVGGKRATGHGLLSPVVGNRIELTRPREAMSAVDPTALGPRVGELFRRHVDARRTRIVSFLTDVNA